MKIFNKIIKVLLLLSFIIPSVYALEKNVIVISDNIDITELSKSDLENIFLGRKTFWSHGERISISLSSQNPSALNQFLTDYIGQNKRRFKKFWLKKVFSGYGIAPKIFKNNEKALKFLKEHENSIIYMTVDDSQKLEGIKLINVDGKKYF
ncbi:MAG: hypothetical protein COB99_03485 [Sulfurimonas sp.]|nr:MAG: hypothetical protein COB99_03485 [Sulfurimonas sp.]